MRHSRRSRAVTGDSGPRARPGPPCPAQTEPSSLMAWLDLACLGANRAKLPTPLLTTLTRPIGFKQSAPKIRKPLRERHGELLTCGF